MSSDVTQSAYQEIISGIQGMDDPKNFFAGLAKLNKDLKSSGERYYITTDDLVKINNAYVIDTFDLLTIGQRKITNSESDNQISNTEDKKIPKSSSFASYAFKQQKVPSENMNLVLETNSPISDSIFATKYTFMIRSVHFLLENSKHNISDIVKDSFQNLKDLETLTLVLKSQTDETIKKFLEILLRFMIIIPSKVNDGFCKIFPFVPLLVGALQFLLRCLETNLLHFDVEGDNKELIVELCKKFTEWLDEQLDEIDRLRINPNAERRCKTRKICTDCQGFYFVYEE